MKPMTASSPLVGLLRLLGDGALHAPADLAQQLGVSEPLVAAMTEDLAAAIWLRYRQGAEPPAPAAVSSRRVTSPPPCWL